MKQITGKNLQEIDQGKVIRRPFAVILSVLIVLTLALSACTDDQDDQAVVDVDSMATVQPEQDDTDAIDSEAISDTLEAVDTEAEGTETEIDDVTVITDTELITATEVTTDVTVTTDTVVVEENLVTTVITDTELVTDVVESSDSTTVTDTEVITNTEDISAETSSGEAVANVEVTPVAPTPTPTVMVEVTKVVTETVVVTDTVSATAVATPQPGQEAQTSTTDTAVAFIGIEGSTGRSIRASTLLDANFETADGEVSGEIQDLVVNIQNGQVLYALLEYGGVLDIGDTDMPVPLSAFSWGADEDDLILNVPGQELENYPGVDNDWPVPDDDSWDNEVRNFWNGNGFDTDYDSAESMSGIRRVSNLLDSDISGSDFEDGDVDDLIISLGEGRVTYALISFGWLDLDNERSVVPFSAIDAAASEDGLTLNSQLNASTIEQAPRYDDSMFDNSGIYEDDYDADWHTFWDNEGYR